MSSNEVLLDAITSEIIPPERLITIQEGDTLYHFDVKTLHRQYKTSGKLINPFTTLKLEQSVCDRVMEYEEEQRIIVTFDRNTHYFNAYQTLGDVIVKCLSEPFFKRVYLESDMEFDSVRVTDLEDLELPLSLYQKEFSVKYVESESNLKSNRKFLEWLKNHESYGVVQSILYALLEPNDIPIPNTIPDVRINPGSIPPVRMGEMLSFLNTQSQIDVEQIVGRMFRSNPSLIVVSPPSDNSQIVNSSDFDPSRVRVGPMHYDSRGYVTQLINYLHPDGREAPLIMQLPSVSVQSIVPRESHMGNIILPSQVIQIDEEIQIGEEDLNLQRFNLYQDHGNRIRDRQSFFRSHRINTRSQLSRQSRNHKHQSHNRTYRRM